MVQRPNWGLPTLLLSAILANISLWSPENFGSLSVRVGLSESTESGSTVVGARQQHYEKPANPEFLKSASGLRQKTLQK
jgi:hypothetical protein